MAYLKVKLWYLEEQRNHKIWVASIRAEVRSQNINTRPWSSVGGWNFQYWKFTSISYYNCSLYSLSVPINRSRVTEVRYVGILHDVFIDAAKSSNYTAWNDWMTKEYWIWKDEEPWRSWPNLRGPYSPGICFEGLRETMKNLSHYTEYLDRDSNRVPPIHKSEGLTLEPPCPTGRKNITSPKWNNNWILTNLIKLISRLSYYTRGLDW
jgi:hypothetical protein